MNYNDNEIGLKRPNTIFAIIVIKQSDASQLVSLSYQFLASPLKPQLIDNRVAHFPCLNIPS